MSGSVLYRAKLAVKQALLDNVEWADMPDCVFIGLANLEIEDALTVRITASNFQAIARGSEVRGWTGQVDIAVFSQGDDTTAAAHAEWCGRIEAFVTQSAGDIESRISEAAQGVILQGASPSAAQDSVIDGLMVTRYGIEGIWTIKE